MTQLGQDEPRPAKRHRSRKYSSTPLAVMPDVESMGPALRALSPKARRFILELRDGPSGYGSIIRAARVAYGEAGSNAALKVTACEALQDAKVQAAMLEVGLKKITAAAFQAIGNVERIANDARDPNCFKANIELMNRGGFAPQTHHTVTVEHRVDYTKQALEELATFRRLGVAREQLEQIYGRDGLFHLEQQLDPGKLIDGKVESEAD
jgi:hypothetical protein